MNINMNGASEDRRFNTEIAHPELAYKDAVLVSPHKMMGGPGSSGVLIVKKSLVLSKTPDRVGGGPVFFVNELDHEFTANVEELEEAGTPGVI